MTASSFSESALLTAFYRSPCMLLAATAALQSSHTCCMSVKRGGCRSAISLSKDTVFLMFHTKFIYLISVLDSLAISLRYSISHLPRNLWGAAGSAVLKPLTVYLIRNHAIGLVYHWHCFPLLPLAPTLQGVIFGLVFQLASSFCCSCILTDGVDDLNSKSVKSSHSTPGCSKPPGHPTIEAWDLLAETKVTDQS